MQQTLMPFDAGDDLGHQVIQYSPAESDNRSPTDEKDELPQVPEAFTVRDDATAEWVVRHIIQSRAHVKRVQMWADREIHRARQEEAFFASRFGNQLEAFLRMQMRDRRLRRRSISLPSGTIGLRRLPPRLTVEQDVMLLEWARLHLPDSIRISITASGRASADLRGWCEQNCRTATIKEHVARAELNDYVGATGEIPPGTQVEAGIERLYVS